jgi:hypothetical protein
MQETTDAARWSALKRRRVARRCGATASAQGAMSTHGSRCNYDSKVGRHNNIGEAILTCGPRGPAGEGVGDEELDTAKRLRAGDAGVHGYNRSASPLNDRPGLRGGRWQHPRTAPRLPLLHFPLLTSPAADLGRKSPNWLGFGARLMQCFLQAVVGEVDGGERLRMRGCHLRWRTWPHDFHFPRGRGGEREHRKGKGKKEEERCGEVAADRRVPRVSDTGGAMANRLHGS